MKNIIIYKIPKSEIKIDLEVNNKTFKPTLTTDLLIKSSLKILKKNKSILDLGCGIGVIGIALSKLGYGPEIFASDISKEATEMCLKNCKKNNLKIFVKTGDRLDPWGDQTFDYIIDDVSGVSDIISKKSKWFKNVPNNSGKDGSNLIISIIEKINKNLNRNGVFIFPIISLSNKKKILDVANKYFNKIELVSNSDWFLPEDLNSEIDLLFQLKEKNLIDFQYKFGKIICSTEIFCAKKN